MINLLTKEEIETVFERFKKQNPSPQSELKAKNPYTFLVSVTLSAQATDKSVNKATERLYEIADSPRKMIDLGEAELIGYIRSIGLYRSKARHIIDLSKILEERFNGEVPRDREALMTLPGVGRKTANVALNALYGEPVMPVDTHIMRISPRIGLAEGKTPEALERALVAVIPRKYMRHAHHWLILHGRYVCKARGTLCDSCILNDVCKKNGMDAL